MSKKKAKRPPKLRQAGFAACLRNSLSPALFRQVDPALPGRFRAKRRGRSRWTLQPLLFTLLCLTWCQGDSQPERFETARAFYVASHQKRRRPGKTYQGFRTALEALPARCLRQAAAVVRRHLATRLGPLLLTDGWAVFGCDGSRLLCPRADELERHLGDPGGDSSSGHKPPQLWLTALVHLASGVPWAWRLGKGDASERDHLARLVGTLMAGALVVTDAGYQAYALACCLADAGAFFLMRVSSQTIFYTKDASLEAATLGGGVKEVTAAEMGKWEDKTVYYWPKKAQEKGQKALEVRLIRVRGKKSDVWLVSNVLDAGRLTAGMAGKFYRMRWENEGYFRTYKRTMKKVKLSGRTVKAVHREALGAMLAVQVLLAQGAVAAVALGKKQAANSARQLLLLARREMQDALRGRGKRGFLDRAAACEREDRERTSAKQKRPWPSRQAPKPLLPPKVRLLGDDAILILDQCLGLAA